MKICMKGILFLTFLPLIVSLVAAERPFDFRASDAYHKLSAADKERLEKVHSDLVLLWGALDIYADQHSGNLPATLDDLVPTVLAKLPTDPFAIQESESARITHVTQSKKGTGYSYKRGAPGNRAWVISSVGLADFPYLAERGNVGLYICKGTWISGINPMISK